MTQSRPHKCCGGPGSRSIPSPGEAGGGRGPRAVPGGSSPILALQPSPLSRAPQGPLYRAPPSGGPRQGSGLPWGQPRRGLCPGAGPSPGAAEGAGGQGPLQVATGAAGDGGLHPWPCPAPGLAGLGRGSPRSPGGLAWPLPACFLRLITALPPLGSSQKDPEEPQPPHQGFLRPRSLWNSQEFGNLSQNHWGEGTWPRHTTPLPSSSTPPHWGDPWPLSPWSVEVSLRPLPPAMLGVGQGHECPLLPTQDSAWGLEAPEVSHTPCQNPPRASPSSHEIPDGKGPGAKAG